MPDNRKIFEWNDPDRFLAGIDLFRAQRSNRLIFTGGVNPLKSDVTPEGDMYIQAAISMGLPKNNLYSTYPVFNTYQEAKAIKKLLNSEIGSRRKDILLVTSAFHMKRAKKVFEREGFLVRPYPVDFNRSKNFKSLVFDPLNWLPSAKSLDRSSSAIREFIGRIFYRSL